MTREIGKSPLLAMPYGAPYQRRMVAEDLTRPGGPAYDALLTLERNDTARRAELYLEMSRALELAYLKPPEMIFPGSVFGFDPASLTKDKPEP